VLLARIAPDRLQLITPVLSYDDFARVDMVVEAVFEGVELKKEVFGELDRVCVRRTKRSDLSNCA
jgi:3-hydroxyacyl-CoA dehydrogenase